jgi:hypothetical protein
MLTRCLQDDSLPAGVRAAGALVLLYGVPVSKVVELTREHLDTSGEPAAHGLRLTRTSPVIVVPPALGRLLGLLPAMPRNPSAVVLIERAQRQGWLFPGPSAHGHVNPSVLAQRLKTHGIQIRPSRNAALIALAADLPAALLTSLFDVSIRSAVQWTRRAGRDWQAYLAAETQRRTAGRG